MFWALLFWLSSDWGERVGMEEGEGEDSLLWANGVAVTVTMLLPQLVVSRDTSRPSSSFCFSSLSEDRLYKNCEVLSSSLERYSNSLTFTLNPNILFRAVSLSHSFRDTRSEYLRSRRLSQDFRIRIRARGKLNAADATLEFPPVLGATPAHVLRKYFSALGVGILAVFS